MLNPIQLTQISFGIQTKIPNHANIKYLNQQENESNDWKEFINSVLCDATFYPSKRLYLLSISNYKNEIKSYLINSNIDEYDFLNTQTIIDNYKIFKEKIYGVGIKFSMFWEGDKNGFPNEILKKKSDKYAKEIKNSNWIEYIMNYLIDFKENKENLKLVFEFLSEMKLFESITKEIESVFFLFFDKQFKEANTSDIFQQFNDFYTIVPFNEIIFKTKLELYFYNYIVSNISLEIFIKEMVNVLTQNSQYLNVFIRTIVFDTNSLHEFLFCLINKYSNNLLEFILKFYQELLLLPKDILFLFEKIMVESIRNNPEPFITLIVQCIDKKIRENESVSMFANSFLIFVYSSLFEDIYLKNLIKRLFDTPISIIRDKEFIDMYKKKNGPQSFQKIQNLLNDYTEGLDDFAEFQSKNEIPNFLVITPICYNILLSSTQQHNCLIPKEILNATSIFEDFYKFKYSNRKLIWNLELSKCTLSINQIKVKCNGIIALILLSLNNGNKTIKEISSRTHLKTDIIKSYCKLLSSSNLSNIIINTSGKYGINSNISNDFDLDLIPEQINIPNVFQSQESEKLSKIQNVMSLNAQIDSCISQQLKKGKLKKSELLFLIREKISFSITDEMIESRLLQLIHKSFIKEIPPCTYEYIP